MRGRNEEQVGFLVPFPQSTETCFFLILLLDFWSTELEQVSFSTLVGDAQKGMFCSSLYDP